jgi:parallel beta-helix repeat protein
MLRKWFVLTIALSFLGLNIMPSSAEFENIETTAVKILYVGGGGLNNYDTIQDAIDDASNGDTVYVYDDSSPYVENVIVSKAVRLIGENKDTTIIDGKEIGTVIRIESGVNGVRIHGFTIQNSGLECSGILVMSNNNIITDNRIIDSWTGVELLGSSNNIITDNTITHNEYGIYITDSSNNQIIGNAMAKNSWSDLSLFWSPSNIITDNTFSKGIFIFGELLSYWNTHTIEENTINGKPIRYYKNCDQITVPEYTAQVILANCNGGTIQGLYLQKTNAAILMGFSQKITIRNNHLTRNDYGIYASNACYNVITKNIFTYNHNRGIELWDSSYNRVIDNTLDYNTYGGIGLTASFNNVVSRNVVKNGDVGIGLYIMQYLLLASYNNIISENVLGNNNMGIFVGGSFNNIVTSNTATNNLYGVFLDTSHDNVVTKNIITSNNDGITLREATSNTITSNFIIDNIQDGIRIRDGSCYNVIFENAIEANYRGIDLRNSWNSCTNNIIYHNNFKENSYKNAYDYYTNFWYNEVLGHGNYWDDYDGIDEDGDGIGDTPYDIPGQGNNQDIYPLMKPWPLDSISTVSIT